MTAQQVIGLALRLVALFLVMKALTLVPIALGSESYAQSSGAGVYVSALLYLVMAVYLWKFPMSVAHRLLPRSSHTDKIITNSNQIAVAGVALLGLWLLVVVLPSLFYQVAKAIDLSGGGSLFESLAREGGGLILLTDLFRLVMACVLLFKARRIARFLTA